MSAQLRRPHETKTSAGVSRLVRENFTARFVERDQTPLIAQDGNVFSDSGTLVKEVPAWFWEHYVTLSDDMKELLKLKPPGEKKG